MKDFNQENLNIISSEICGNKVDEIRINNDRMDDYLEIVFCNGKVLKIRYDYIYEFEYK